MEQGVCETLVFGSPFPLVSAFGFALAVGLAAAGLLHAAAIAALNNSLRRICTWALVQMCLELRNTVE
mgnify:CR=1 FL=1